MNGVTDDGAKVGWKTVPLTDKRVLRHLRESASIMLHRKDRRSFRGKGIHYKPRLDMDGWHIRLGKGAVVKQYLTECEITFIDGEVSLFSFRTS